MLRFLVASLFLIPLVASLSRPTHAASVHDLMEAYGKSVVQTGDTIGIGIAVIETGKAPKFYSYGDAVVGYNSGPTVPFSADSLFQIGSVTKVFTTNLLGQDVAAGILSLKTKLAAYKTQIGKMKKQMRRVKLKQLGSFTGGIADYAPLCSTPNPPPGCLPSGRPTIKQYGGSDFAAYFANATPMDYQNNPPSPTDLPAPYFYSDFGVGLLGLLLAGTDAPLRNRDVRDWFDRVHDEILQPLDMNDTFLKVPASQGDRVASGYNQALAVAEVTNGAVSGISLQSKGGFYSSAPRVRITGGGGSGARAVAIFDGDEVGQINVIRAGSGYIAPAKVLFKNGGSSTTAFAHTIIRKGKVVAIAVTDGGAGYKQVPDVVVKGGRKGGGAATATAHLVNGKVAYVSVDDPGSGYVKPLSVLVAPGGAAQNAIPIWAPAGSISTSVRDMAKFVEAALHSKGHGAAYAVTEGFRIAERPYACTGSTPQLSTCPADNMRSGLAWAVQPADTDAGVPSIVSKDGSLGGFTTYVALMPEKGLGVVVFANSRETLQNTGGPSEVAPHVANNILYALYFGAGGGSRSGR